MAEQQPWTKEQIGALYGNLQRKLAAGAQELFLTYLQEHPEIDQESDLTDEQVAAWESHRDKVLGEYEANKRASIARVEDAHRNIAKY